MKHTATVSESKESGTPQLNKSNLVAIVETLLTIAHNMRQLSLFVAVFNVYYAMKVYEDVQVQHHAF